jgi:hypothetical protein
MSAARPEPGLREIRRGEAPDEIEVIDEEGYVLLARAHGVTPDERLRVRERLLRLLADGLDKVITRR